MNFTYVPPPTTTAPPRSNVTYTIGNGTIPDSDTGNIDDDIVYFGNNKTKLTPYSLGSGFVSYYNASFDKPAFTEQVAMMIFNNTDYILNATLKHYYTGDTATSVRFFNGTAITSTGCTVTAFSGYNLATCTCVLDPYQNINTCLIVSKTTGVYG